MTDLEIDLHNLISDLRQNEKDVERVRADMVLLSVYAGSSVQDIFENRLRKLYGQRKELLERVAELG